MYNHFMRPRVWFNHIAADITLTIENDLKY